MTKMFKPNPLQPFDPNYSQPRCLCGTHEEYEDFLIGEYGAEKVLEVKREDERTRKMFENMSDIDRIMALFMGCCGLGEGIFGDGRL